MIAPNLNHGNPDFKEKASSQICLTGGFIGFNAYNFGNPNGF